MEIIDDATLLSEIEAFLQKHRLSPSRFGRETMGDAGLITHLRNGRSLSLRNARKVGDFMSKYDATTRREVA